MISNVYLIGSGGNSNVIHELCDILDINILGIFDDFKENVLGKIKDVNNNKYYNSSLIITMGHNRSKILNKINISKFNFPNLIHPNAYISPSAQIGHGNIIYRNVILNTNVILGDHNLINTSAIIEHDCKIGNTNSVAPNATICGTCVIGSNNFIGASTTIKNNINIGNYNTIGCSSNVIKDIDNNITCYGNPCHKKS